MPNRWIIGAGAVMVKATLRIQLSSRETPPGVGGAGLGAGGPESGIGEPCLNGLGAIGERDGRAEVIQEGIEFLAGSGSANGKELINLRAVDVRDGQPLFPIRK